MRVYIIRHGQSPSAAEAGVDSDAERPLSASGRQDITRLAKALKNKKAAPSVILVSPLKRALETAGILGVTLEPPSGLKKLPALSGQASVDELWRAVEWEFEGKNYAQAALVGHQPQLGGLVQWLTGETPSIYPGTCLTLDTDAKPKARLLDIDNP